MAIRERWPERAEKTGRRAYRSLNSRPVSTPRPDTQLNLDALKARVETLEGENDILKRQLSQRDPQLTAAETRAEMQAVEIAVRDAQYAAHLATERGKTDKPITEYMALPVKFAAEREGRP